MFSSMALDLSPPLKTIPFLKDAPGRALRAAGREARWFTVPAGWTLFEANEPADSIFFVLSGSLGAFRQRFDGEIEFTGHIRAGEPVGEMALFSGGPSGAQGPARHSNSVYALRDTEILEISRTGFERIVKSDPAVLERLMRIMLVRLRQAGRRSHRAEPKIFALAAASPTIDLKLRTESLRASLENLGLSVAIVDKEMGDEKPQSYFDAIEADHDVVLLSCAIGDDSWYKLAIRQADRIWVLGRSDARPSKPLMPADPSPARRFKLVDIVILHHGQKTMATRPDEWTDAAEAARLFHWSGVKGEDCDRLARIIAGRSVGLVMSGGGARAYAHIGVVRAMRERGVPIDFAGGASMGAVVAACVSMGWDDNEIDWRIRKGFVESNPLSDWRLPVISMVRGARVNNRLKEHFGDTEIGALSRPFFAVSTNLNTGAFKVHREGRVRDALRASIALPGILPPVIEGGDVLVDGAVLNNFPVDVMRDFHRGVTLGSDVARQPEGLDASEFVDPPTFLGWIARHGFRSAPPIAGLLMRAATVSVDPKAGGEHCDLFIEPDLGEIELRDWRCYDEAVEAGYNRTIEVLDQNPAALTPPTPKPVVSEPPIAQIA
ncbi:MAG: patatin-like phospholipase family protein [Pseudomonadota bacterium]